MEESLKDAIFRDFSLSTDDWRRLSPLTLAYLGDAVFDVVIRTIVVGKGDTSPNRLHKQTSSIVKAQTQARLADAIKEDLTDEESEILRRGRNAKSRTMAKNASVAEYRLATGFEALIGYLYLTNQTERMLDLIQSGLASIEQSLI